MDTENAANPLANHPEHASIKAMGLDAPPDQWTDEQRRAVGIDHQRGSDQGPTADRPNPDRALRGEQPTTDVQERSFPGQKGQIPGQPVMVEETKGTPDPLVDPPASIVGASVPDAPYGALVNDPPTGSVPADVTATEDPTPTVPADFVTPTAAAGVTEEPK
jgi:hypothetical protein